jgi:hypothetical protein
MGVDTVVWNGSIRPIGDGDELARRNWECLVGDDDASTWPLAVADEVPVMASSGT